MNILLINNKHWARGGADVVYLNTIKMLHNHGHQVSSLSSYSEKNEYFPIRSYFIKDVNFFSNNFFYRIKNTFRFFYSKESKRVIKHIIETEKPEIIHIHLYKSIITSSILNEIKKSQIPVILTLHDYGLLCPHNLLLDGENKICEQCLKINPIMCLLKRCNRKKIIYSLISYLEYIFNNNLYSPLKYFTTIITVSIFSLNLHNKYYPDEKNIFVHLYNFFEKSNFKSEIPKRGNYFLFYGRLAKEKGLRTLINTWIEFQIQSPLLIVGEGDEKESLEKVVKTNNNCGIQFLGYKKGNELLEIIDNASFIIVPSEWYENNPLTIIESYSLGKPVICSDVGGIPEIVLNKETGFLFEMGSKTALSKCIKDAELLTDEQYFIMSKAALDFSENHFSEEENYKKLLGIYNQAKITKSLKNRHH